MSLQCFHAIYIMRPGYVFLFKTNMKLKLIRRHFLMLFYLLAGIASEAQVVQLSQSSFTCSYDGEPIPGDIRLFASTSEATEAISRILSVIGLRQNFEIRSAEVPNAAAVIHRNKRYILYNPKFINNINSSSQNNWASVSILAHEIGHHLNGHTLLGTESRPDIELEADEFSGFVLRRLGASLEDAQAAMKIAASKKASHTHPARNDRLKAIERGWNNAGDVHTGKPAEARKTDKNIEKPVIVKKPEKDQVVLDEKYISLKVFFNADPAGLYYITVKNNLVKVSGSEIYVIGRLSGSNRKGYKYMLSDKQYNYMYINSKGIIVNGAGKKVGSVKGRIG